MRLSLIGMSGAGKSHWASRLENLGYRKISCDDMIADQLGPLLDSNGKSTLELASWMGRPHEKQYPETQSKYLQLETKVVSKICDELEDHQRKKEKIIVDTTGSVIYLDQNLIMRLRELTKTIYLKLPTSNSESAFENYLKDPKPMIWGDHYLPKPDEDAETSLERCYKNLVNYRSNKYLDISDYEIDYEIHNSSKLTPENFIKLVYQNLT